MTLLPTAGAWVDATSGVLLLALGLAVLRLRPRRRANVALAVASAGLGLGFLLGNLVSRDDPLRGILEAAAIPLFIASAAAQVGLALMVPGRLRPEERRLLALPAAVLAVDIALVAWWLSLVPPLELSLADATISLSRPASWFAVLVLAQRYPRGGEAWRAQAALLALALTLYPAVSLAWPLADVAAGRERGLVAALDLARATLPVAVTVLFWLRLASQQPPPASRRPRDLALVTLAFPAAALALSPWLGEVPRDSGVNGVARAIAVGILAYAILRHQLLGIDVKLKWTVRQSTVAAAFVGTGFVVSEAATSAFSDVAGSQYLGIAAAGLLVFALAPLQRAAERVADAAMPGVKPPAEMDAGERASFYREQAQLAWADGELQDGERSMLARQRARLGLSAEEALDIERQLLSERPVRKPRGPRRRETG